MSTTLRRPRALTLLVTVAAGAMLASGVSPAQARASVVDIRPAELDRGPDPAIPHVEDTTFVDGDRRVEIDAEWARYLGPSGDAHLLTGAPDGAEGRDVVWRLEADDTLRVVATGVDASSVAVSPDGTTLADGVFRQRQRTTTVRVRPATGGQVTDAVSFGGYQQVLATEAEQVLVASDRRTAWWTTGEEPALERVSRRGGYHADLSADRLASFTGDPYEGGCTVVTSISRPREVISRMCGQRVEAFSPDGRRMATVFKLSDGIGPGEVQLRRITGRTMATYRAPSWFGEIVFESPSALLLDTASLRRHTLVRCEGVDCERASRTRHTRTP